MKCALLDCEEEVYKGISLGPGTFINVCKEHYKEWKKETKGDRDLERARYDRF